MVKKKRKSEREGFYFAISLLFYIFLSNQSSINLSYHALSPSFPNPTKHILPFSTQLIPTNPILSQNIPTYPVSTHIYPHLSNPISTFFHPIPTYPGLTHPILIKLFPILSKPIPILFRHPVLTYPILTYSLSPYQ